ncbi:MAG: hypothetical protein AAGL24_18355 [Pseudomonadota bacterium]
MSASPMRSVIRILSDSPIVERIALNQESNKIQIHYRDDAKNSAAIHDLVEIINFYFEKIYNANNALHLVSSEEGEDGPDQNRYYLNTYALRGHEFFRLDIQNRFTGDDEYFQRSRNVLDAELHCLEQAKKSIVAKLGTKKSGQKACVEFNYSNIRDENLAKRYLSALRDMPSAVLADIEASIVRVPPNARVRDIDAAVSMIDGVLNRVLVSYFHSENTAPSFSEFVRSRAAAVIATLDCCNVTGASELAELRNDLIRQADGKDVLFVMRKLEPNLERAVLKERDTFRFAGKQSLAVG